MSAAESGDLIAASGLAELLSTPGQSGIWLPAASHGGSRLSMLPAESTSLTQACAQLSQDAGVAVVLQAAAASSTSSTEQGSIMRTAVRILRAIRRSEASIRNIQAAQVHVAALEASLPPSLPPQPSVPILLEASTQVLGRAALGVLDATGVKQAALAVISVVLQLAECGKLHLSASLPVVSLPATSPSAAEAVWPQPAAPPLPAAEASADGASPPPAPSACCLLQLLTPPVAVALRRWQRAHPSGDCTAMLFLEDIAFVPVSETPRQAVAAHVLEEEAAAAEATAVAFTRNIAQAGCTVLLCQKTVSPLVIEAAQDTGILCIPRLGAANASKLQSVLTCPAVQTWEAVLATPAAQLRSLCSEERIWCGPVGPVGTPVLAVASSVSCIAVRGATELQRGQVRAAVEDAFRAVLAKVCSKPDSASNKVVLESLSDACAASLSTIGVSQGWLSDARADCGDVAHDEGGSELLQALKIGLHAALVISDDEFHAAAR